jgi:aminoglycoside phosphotransferase (APT) family kinase protein
LSVAPVSSDIHPRRLLEQLGFHDTSEPVAVPGGWETLMWRFTTPDGAEHALRIYCLDNGERAVRRERIAMDACAAAGIITPRIEAEGVYDGLPAIVQTWIPGETLIERGQRRPWQLPRIAREFGRLHARIHTIPAPRELRADAPRDWLTQILPRHMHLAERLLAAGVSSDTLVHLDYHPLNVIVDGAEPAVIDWAYSAAGDVRADLALTAVALQIAPSPQRSRFRLLERLSRWLAVRSWRKGYRDVAGDLPDYRPFMAWACAFRYRVTDASLGRPGVWATEHDQAELQRHIDRFSEPG